MRSDPLEVTRIVRASARSVVTSAGVRASNRRRNTPPGVSRQLAEGLASITAVIVFLHFLAVAGAELVEDDQVEPEALQAAVLVGLERLSDHAVFALLIDHDQENRQVAGDAVAPQRVARLPVARNGLGVTQARVGKSQTRGQALNRVDLPVIQVQVPQFGLAVAAGHGQTAGHGLPIVVFLDQARRLFLGFGVARDKREPCGRARGQPHALAEAHDGSSTAPLVPDRDSRVRRASGIATSPERPRKRARSVSNSAPLPIRPREARTWIR